ncbi:MAG: GNAT family N-acetyltransferase [Actinomycetota bacterium]
MRLRRGEPEDVASVARLMRSTYDLMTFIPRLHTPDEDCAYVTSLFADHEVWVADGDDEVLGFAVLTADQLLQIHVAPGEQSKGIGTLLLDRAKERRPAGFSLWVFQKNEGARRFYERHGLDLVLLTDGQGNEEREPDAQYAWRPS